MRRARSAAEKLFMTGLVDGIAFAASSNSRSSRGASGALAKVLTGVLAGVLGKEAGIRVALSDAAPLYRHAPETQEVRAASKRTFQVFMREALPKSTDAARALASD